MNIKMISMAAVALAVMSGSAFAASNASEGTPVANPDSVLNDATKMAPFYTDSTMKTMRSEEEFKAAWMAMKPDDQASMKKECADEAMSVDHKDFCSLATKYAGDK